MRIVLEMFILMIAALLSFGSSGSDFSLIILNRETESTIGELFIFIPIPVFRYDFLPKIVDLTTTPTIFLY